MSKNYLINNLFFDFIKIAVERKDYFVGIPTTDEWKEIYKLAKQQTIVGVLFDAIERLPKEQCPPKPLLLKWFAETEIIQEQNNLVNIDAVKLCTEFRIDNKRCLILKGQSIAQYYPKPLLRTSGDIDLWIEGGTHKVIQYLRSKGEVRNITYKHMDFDVAVKTKVEIHHNPTYFYNPLHNYRLRRYIASQKDLFNNDIELPNNIGKISIPKLEFNRYYILQHIFRHYFGEGVGLRQLFDYYYVLLKGGTEESKQRTLDMFKQTGMMKFVGATMWVMKEVFDLEDKYLLCSPNEKAGKQLLDEIMLAGNFGKYDSRINRSNHHKLLPRVWNSFKRKLRFILDYPQEVLFDIPMRTYMYIWKHFV